MKEEPVGVIRGKQMQVRLRGRPEDDGSWEGKQNGREEINLAGEENKRLKHKTEVLWVESKNNHEVEN